MDFEEDPSFQDMPHLFIEKGAKYQELILPSGLPNDKQQVIQNKDLVELEKKELDRIIQKLNIEGRPKMNKKELPKAISKAK